MGNISRTETEQVSRGTHTLESEEWAMSAEEKQSNLKQADALTNWKTKVGQHQQKRNRVSEQSHSQTGEDR